MSAKAKTKKNTTKPTVKSILGEGGVLAKALDRYEHREPQLEMATAVSEALADEKPLIIEAATGTGKTLAYLVPALLSGKRVVVSTGTKALQEQLFHKDIPLLGSCWHKPFNAVLLKGRRNYICKMRVQEMMLNPRFRAASDAHQWGVIREWYAKTETGDRADVPGLPDDYATWADLSVGSEACKGAKCKYYESCFVTQARKQAAEAEIIVVNHHLFFADLALRQQGYAEVIPDYDAVIFDEAHHLEEIASNYFGTQVSNWRVNELIQDIKHALSEEDISDDDLEARLKTLNQRGTSFFTLLAFGLYEGRYPIGEVLSGPQASRIDDSRGQFAVALTELERELKRFATKIEMTERLVERTSQLKFDLDELIEASDERYTYFMEVRDRGVFLNAAPIDLGELFQTKLYAEEKTLVFTSATLSTGGTFAYFKRRMGMVPVSKNDEKTKALDVREIKLDAIFDYENQCLVYVPNRLPAPNSPKFVDGVVQIVEYLVGITQGRAFVLFTSWANMRAVHEELAERLDFTVLKQGDMPKRELIAAFKKDKNSVLFATSSFWEGVDVEGDALQLVIIDKLPFASPSDPLVRARMDLLEARGGNSFFDYSVPGAALMLKQGFGRLIRSQNDTGVVAILDSRIATKRYGDHFLDSLPPAPVVWRAPAVKQWWYDKFGKPDDA